MVRPCLEMKLEVTIAAVAAVAALAAVVTAT